MPRPPEQWWRGGNKLAGCPEGQQSYRKTLGRAGPLIIMKKNTSYIPFSPCELEKYFGNEKTLPFRNAVRRAAVLVLLQIVHEIDIVLSAFQAATLLLQKDTIFSFARVGWLRMQPKQNRFCKCILPTDSAVVMGETPGLLRAGCVLKLFHP